MECWRSKKKKKKKGKGKEKEEEPSEWFLKNESMFLEEHIKDCNDISNSIRMFSSVQISEATNTKGSLSEDRFFTWYNGSIEGRPYVIKKSVDSIVNSEDSLSHHYGAYPEMYKKFYKDYQEQAVLDYVMYMDYCRIEGRSYAIDKLRESWHYRKRVCYNDIALSAEVSNHNGFLKLIGCCLEFPLPVMVFENQEYRALNKRGSVGSEDGPLLPWNVRLKIVKDVAIAVTYLHTAFPKITVHRDIKPTNVLLDENWNAKLTDFSSSITLPEGKSSIKDIPLGTSGYMDPNFCYTDLVTEYTDVFSFGIFMLVLLMGRPPVLVGPDGRVKADTKILDNVKDLQKRGRPVKFGGDSNDMKLGQMNKFLELALRCCEERNEDRPKMILVSKELKLIER